MATFNQSENNRKMLKGNLKLSHFECVGEFHDTFGHPLRKTIYTDCFDKEPKLVPFRISLMREELNEFKDALKNNDIVEMADALCDLSYVTNGTGHCLGIDLDTLMNQLKININTPNTLDTACDYTLAEFEKKSIEYCAKQIETLLENFCKAYDNKNIETMMNSLAYILDATYKLGHDICFNMNAMFREVHRSNMTKVCANIDDAIESIKKYKEDGRYKNPAMKLKGQYYVIYDASTSKILKNHKWETPNLKQFM